MHYRVLLSSFCLMVSANAFCAGVHFVMIDGKLGLFSSDGSLLKQECEGLERYTERWSERNHSIFRQNSTRCAGSNILPIDPLKTPVIIPSYNSPERIRSEIEKGPGYFLPVSGWFPMEIWKRVKYVPQDGVCYNSSLIESMILPESNRSSFLKQIDFFLGMNGISEFEINQSEAVISFGKRSSSPLVAARKTFEANGVNRDEILAKSRSFIRNNFTPGSVLCVSVDDTQRKDDAISFVSNFRETLAEKGIRLKSNVESLPDSYLRESPGGHCLVFLTPELVSESNLRLPKNLLNWEVAFDFYYAFFQRTNGGKGSFHYFQITPDLNKMTWAESQISSSPQMSLLVNFLKQHRQIYENLAWEACPPSSSTNFYSSTCLPANQNARDRLVTFWRGQGEQLMSRPEFGNFRDRLTSQYVSDKSDMETTAFDLFRDLVEFRNKLIESN